MQPKPRAAIRPTNLEAFPEELKARRAFVCWRYEEIDGKPTKVPYNARTGKKASSTNASTWSSYQQAVSAYKRGDYEGIGLVITTGSGYVGVDLDHCIVDGAILDWAQLIVDTLDSYTEVSPSGTGLRIWCHGSLPPEGRKKGDLEMYDGGRYLTVTGRHVAGTPLTVEERTAEIAAVHRQYWPEPEHKPTVAAPPREIHIGDQEVLDRAREAVNQDKFKSLWNGDTGAYHSRSEAHLALCNILAFWCGPDRAQIDRLFRQSGLFSDAEQARKWDTIHGSGRRTYGEITIDTALENRTDFFDPAQAGKLRNGVAPAAGEAEAPSATPEQERPIVKVLTGREHEAIAAIVGHIAAAHAEEPRFFRQEGVTDLYRLAVVDRDGYQHRMIVPVEAAYVRDAITETVALQRWNERKHEYGPTTPTETLINSVTTFLPEACPVLAGVTEIPVFRADGSLQKEPGYDEITRLFYQPAPGLSIPDVSMAPTVAERNAAAALINELIEDFDFAGDAEKHNAVALFILPYAKPFIAGGTPLHFLEAPTPGSGKSLLGDCLLRPAYGQIGKDRDLDDDAETSKWLISQALFSRPVCFIDNVRKGLDSGALSSAITGTLLSGRKLGSNTIVDLTYAPVWVATGNNPVLTDEIARRVVRIRLEPNTDRPGTRPQSDFRHVLPDWADERRGQLVHAGLTLVAAWLAAGRPVAPHNRNKGSFTNWARVIGGILHVIGLDEFLANEDSVWVNANADAGLEAEFVELWATKYGYSSANTAKELIEIADEAGLIDKNGKGSPTRRLGMLLIGMRDRMFVRSSSERVQIKEVGRSKRALVYGLRLVNGSKPPAKNGESNESSESIPNARGNFAYSPSYNNVLNSPDVIDKTHQTHQTHPVDPQSFGPCDICGAVSWQYQEGANKFVCAGCGAIIVG